jgi:putative restriction endonuclease
MKTLNYYYKSFSQLNVSNSKKRGIAKYKPILILTVIDLITRGIINENIIPVSDELIQTFEKYWSILGSKTYKGGLYYPFIHLQSEGFWHLVLKREYKGLQPKTNNKLREAVEYASLDNELFDFLQVESSRQELIDSLITTFFQEQQDQFEDILQINQSFQEEDLPTSTNFDNNPKWGVRKAVIRNAFFRKTIVHVYDSKCAFCGIRVTKGINQNIVDGAHIKPFAQFYDSRIHNGIALCKNHHWAFDRGWFTADEQYKIIVSRGLEEISPHTKPIKDFHGEKLLLPNKKQYFPELEALQWHRQNIFQA